MPTAKADASECHDAWVSPLPRMLVTPVVVLARWGARLSLLAQGRASGRLRLALSLRAGSDHARLAFISGFYARPGRASSCLARASVFQAMKRSSLQP